jgi:hypothetical protein
MGAMARKATRKPRARRSAPPLAPSRADVENNDAFRRLVSFCDRLGRGRFSDQDLARLLLADGATRGLTHTEDLIERRAAAAALVAKALPRLNTVERLESLLEQLAQKVDPRFGSLRAPQRGPIGRKGRNSHPPGEHLTEALKTITAPRWQAIRVTAWLVVRSDALTGPDDPKPRTLEFVVPQIYAAELLVRKKRAKRSRTREGAPRTAGRRVPKRR